MPSAELIKDILGPKHFNCFSYIVILFRCSILGILMAVSVKMFIDDAEKNPKNFRCQSIPSSQKNVILEECFNKYVTSSTGHFPFLGFPILELLFIGMVGPLYSSSVKERVKSLENEDVEAHGMIRGSLNGRYLFVAYIKQLFVRMLLEIMFLVLRMKIRTYSSPLFPCHLNNFYNTKHSMNATNHLSQSATRPTYQCFNSGAEKSASFTNILCILNGIFAALAFIEIMYISIKALHKKNFMTAIIFFQTHLKNACSKQERSLVLEEYMLTMKRNILEYTKHYNPIIANIPDRFGQIKQLDINSTYTDLIIYLGTIKHDFSGKREEKLKEYPKEGRGYVGIKTLEEIFTPNKDTKPNECPLNIWILGRPGIGKSFLCLKLLRILVKNGKLIRKANNADLKEFKLIYFYKFRNFNRDEDLNLQQLLGKCQFSGSLPNEVYSWIRSHPEKVLLIFDGLDEFRNKANIENEAEFENSPTQMMPFFALYGKLIAGKLLKGATVVTTLRSTALSCVKNIQGTFQSRIMEISGFSKDKIKEYVDKFFSQEEEAKQKIWKHISMNANLLSLCYVPVNCHIVCCSLQARMNSKEDHSEGLPSTLTEIYEDAVRLIVFKHNPERRNKISTKEDIEAALEKVCELALKGIEEGRLIFDSHEVDNMGQDDTNLLHQLPDEMNHLEPEPQYCFLHLTIQEFLAAKKIVSTARARGLQWLKEWVSNHIRVGEWQLVVQFVAGLLGHEDDCKVEIFTDLVPFSKYEQGGEIWWPRKEEKELVVILFKCLFEMSKELEEDWIKESVEKIGDSNIDMSRCYLNDADVTAVVKVLQHFKTSVHSLIVHNNHIGSLGCLEICKFVLSTNIKMQKIGDIDLNQCKLTKLDISDNGIGDDGLKHLSAALSTNECKVATLNISSNGIGADGLKHLSAALSTNECKLTTLNISSNEIGADGLKHLSAALSTNECKVTTLDISSNGIGADGLKHLSAALSTNECKLTTLNISSNEIGADGLKHLSAALSTNECKVTALDISDNGIGDDKLKHLSDALSTNECKVTTLDISCNGIGADGLTHLSDALSTNESKLTTLNISWNLIGADRLKHLSDALSTNECKVTTLDISSNGIGDDGLKHLSAALSTNECKLTTLNISWNLIGADGLKHLSDALSTNECKVTKLNISYNRIGDDGFKHLSDALSTNECKLTTLNISWNLIGADAFKHLQLIVHNKPNFQLLF